MTTQEIYNKVKNHLLTQMEKSTIRQETTCAYRGTKNKKCAIGCLIDDKDYKKGFETNNILELLEFWPDLPLLPTNILRFEGVQFLKDLQIIHDCYQPCEWNDELKNVAKKFNLKP